MTTKKISIAFQPYGKRARITPDQTIMDAARLSGIFIPSLCGGRGKCGKCRVLITDPKAVHPPTHSELALLGRKGPKGLRLACMTIPTKSLTVEIPQESMEAAPHILVEGLDYEIAIDPIITKHHLRLNPPSIEDPLADFERLHRALSRVGMDVGQEGSWSLRHGPEIMRRAGWDVTVAVWRSSRVIRIEEGDKTQRALGAAVDIGTTTIVCYLVDLITGDTLSSDSGLNPQIPYGEDVVSRLAFSALGPENAKKLHSLVVNEISRLLSSCCRKAKAKLEEILDLCIVGNTVMHHLGIDLPTKYLGVSPFSPVVRRGLDMTAKQVGLRLHPDTPVHALPPLAGYVGADTCGVILASRIYEVRKISMAIDIGTNGEIVLGNYKGLTACSCAAGPALEGAHIKFGMRAAEGAIQRVRIEDEYVEVETIGDKAPIGIAGSGIIDAVAEILLAGAIRSDGRFRYHPRVRRGEDMKEFVLVERQDAGIDDDIVLTQRDIREVQLAKAAIYTGASALMERSEKAPEDISSLYVAGAFGNYVDFAKAKAIGLIPDIPIDRIKFIGNGAAAGAKLALLSRSLREVSEHIAEKINYIELTCAADFADNYMAATYMPHKEAERFPSVRLPR